MNLGKKPRAIAYVRSEIDILSEQTDDGERRAYHHRANAALFAIHAGELITTDEFQAIRNEIGDANEKASRQECDAQR